jgi:hypothetical protein
VIEVMDDLDPYSSLLGIDWQFDNNVMLNLKKRQILYEIDTLCVIAPLYPNEGDRYNEDMNGDVQRSIIEIIYQIIGHREDCINAMIYGELSWISMHSHDIDLEDDMDRWKNKLYEVSTRIYEKITKVVCLINTEFCDAPRFDRTGSVDTLLA